jgi:hypothetical protein
MGLFGPSKNDILTEGRQAMALVRDVTDTGMRVNGKPRIELTLEVQPMGQPAFTVQKKMVVTDDSVPHVGQQLPVRYLPEDTDRCEIDQGALEMTRAEVVTNRGTAPAAPPPPPPPPAPPPVPDPATQQPDPADDLSQTIQEALGAPNVSVYSSGNAQIIDARNNPDIRAQMAKTLQAYGISMPNAPMIGQPMKTQKDFAAEAADDPVKKLEKLSELHKQGVLTDDEFQSAKTKILGEI